MTAVRDEPVAIVGMACMYPGAPDVDAYWRNILNKVDAVSEPPEAAWDPAAYHDPTFADEDKTYCKHGGYLGDMATFDPLEHNIPPVSVGGEPDQWLALKLAKDALVDAGMAELPPEIRERTGVILGKGTYLNGGNAIAIQRGLVIQQTLDVVARLHPEYRDEQLEQLRTEMKAALPPMGPEIVPGLIPNIIVGRIANRLDLMGPSYTVDAACASSLLAVQQSMRHLRDRECDVVLAGGSQVWIPIPVLNVFCQLGALSRKGQIRPFDADADGTLLGEGIGLVVLKRLEDAERDGNRIYATIRGVGVSSDGRGTTVMAPRVEGEITALRRAYEATGVDPETIGLIEAHATATDVGDATEMAALATVFGERVDDRPSCAIGTVKSMISHTIPASGVAGLIKCALALHHRMLPPTLNVDRPNPKLGIERTPFYLNTETRPWIHGGAEPRRAGINSFGFGGINAHAILEEHPTSSPAHLPPFDSELCVLEGGSAHELADAAEALAQRLAARDPEPALIDVARTLAAQVSAPGEHDGVMRLAVVAETLPDLIVKLGKAAERLRKPNTTRIKGVAGIYFAAEPLGREGKVVLLFPGEGAQYPNMLADLCPYFPEVRAAFDGFDRVYGDQPRPTVFSDWIFPRPSFSEDERRAAEARLMDMDVAVAAVLAGNQAVHGLLRRLGVRYDACVGHSSGEYSAAHAAGALRVNDDVQRGRFSDGLYRTYKEAADSDRLPRATLLAIAAERDQVEAVAAEAGGDLMVGMDNCPHQVVLMGDPEAAERARAILDRDGLIYEQLPYDRAVHTPRFAAFSEALRDVFTGLEVGPAETPLYTCTTGDRYPQDADAIRDLLAEHWTQPVEFRTTIERLYDEGARVFVECGPRGNLTAFVDDILRGRPSVAVPANVQRRTGITQLHHLLAQLLVHDVEVDLDALHAGRGGTVIDLDGGGAGDGSEAAPRRLHVELSQRWPMLRLSPEAVQRVRGASPGPSRPVTNGSANGVGNGNGINNGHRPPEPERPAAPAPAAAVAVAPTATAAAPLRELLAGEVVEAPAGPSADEVELAMRAHLATMERFLAAQTEVMQAYLAPAAGQLHAMLGSVVAANDMELVTLRRLDPAEDRYLDDHRLGDALPVMPLTMSLSLGAEAAVALLGGGVVTGLRDVRAHRWIAVEEEVPTLQVRAHRLEDDGPDGATQVRVELRLLTGREDEPQAGSPEVEATVLVADSYPPAPAPLPVDAPDASTLTPDSLYRDVMFHGPRWQGVAGIDGTGPAGIRAALGVLPVHDFLASGQLPSFVLDPIVLDAAGQLVGFWTAEHLDRGRIVFPFRLEALDVYGPPLAPGTPLSGAAVIGLRGDQLMSSDIDVLDDGGHVWMRLTGWEDKRFDLPDALEALVKSSRPPHHAPLSTSWPEPVAALAAAGREIECRRILADLGADAALWRRVWAQRVLTPREREVLERLRAPEGRRIEWLAARTAAKEALQLLLRREHGRDVALTELELLADEQGRPVVAGAGVAGLPTLPVVSMAHAGGLAVALAAPGGDLGVDLEPVRRRADGFADAAFQASELTVIGQLPQELRDEWTLRCFCAKEALAKALGTGLLRSPRDLAVTALDPAQDTVTLELGGGLAALRPDLAGAPLLVHTVRDDDLVVTTTVAEKGGHRDDQR